MARGDSSMVGSGCRAPRIRRARFGALLAGVAFIWCLMLLLLVGGGQRSGEDAQDVATMQENILDMSLKYVKKLASEARDKVDGPYVGKMTVYDMKKTLAVLLDNIVGRLTGLERRMDALTIANGTSLVSGNAAAASYNDAEVKSSANLTYMPVNPRDLLLGAQEDCEVGNEKVNYPNCAEKMEWMSKHWKSDKCYANLGVDGSRCSFRVYLSEIERWCPRLIGRPDIKLANHKTVHAELNFNVSGLMAKLVDPGIRKNYDWIRNRISRMWDQWILAANKLNAKHPLKDRRKKRILIYLGLLTRQSGFKIAENSDKGGPLGELVQWSDIIACLYLLGHDLTIISEVEQLTSILSTLPQAGSSCQTQSSLPIDLLYTDIVGLTQFKRKVKSGYGKFSCLLRIIDSFGTEPAFNHAGYANSHHMKTTWGLQELRPQQFYTMFPHSPDNSFMGFVVDSHHNSSEIKIEHKKDQALVYGKVENMWTGRKPYLDVVHNHVSVHGTVFVEGDKNKVIPNYVVNHGILSGSELSRLLEKTKLFIGMGFPYEGPAPLEAISHGCVFINPRFDPPHSSKTVQFFKGKPTNRELTSQHPYAEMFIGEPHVYTVDIDNKKNLSDTIKKALQKIKTNQVKPYMPFEYTPGGMLQRVNAYTMHQEFCLPEAPLWPPIDDVRTILAKPGVACKEACFNLNLICEPSHFSRLNSAGVVRRYVMSAVTGLSEADITERAAQSEIIHPSYSLADRSLTLQKESLLFSCVGQDPGYRRLCPCRTFIRGQTALCKNCI